MNELVNVSVAVLAVAFRWLVEHWSWTFVLGAIMWWFTLLWIVEQLVRVADNLERIAKTLEEGFNNKGDKLFEPPGIARTLDRIYNNLSEPGKDRGV